jgi:chromosome segregation ATPase
MNSKVQEALEQLHRELERLAPAVNHIEAAQEVTSHVAKLPELFREDAVLSEERYSAAIHLYQQQLDYHAAELSQALEKFQQESGELTSAMSEEGKQLTELRQRISEYQEKIAAIDFPTRLDKLDAIVSGIMAATQTTQGRIDNLERTTAEKLSALSVAVENQQKALATSIEKANKSTRTLLIVSIVLSVLLIAAVVYLFTRT